MLGVAIAITVSLGLLNGVGSLLGIQINYSSGYLSQRVENSLEQLGIECAR
jgi:hypothetical protein